MRFHRLSTLLLALALAAMPIACGGGGGGGGGGDDGLVYRVSGTITGSVLEGITVQLRGDVKMTKSTDIDGDYQFVDVPAGRYAVVPEMDGVTFLPSNRTADVVDRDITDVDFTTEGSPPPLNTEPPEETVRLVFVHRDTGRHWLNQDNISQPWGDLGAELGLNNYYVSEATNNWAEAPCNATIGATTDIGHWFNWFLNQAPDPCNSIPQRDNVLNALYPTNFIDGSFSRIAPPSPLGNNDVILIMSEPLNSQLEFTGPTGPPNPLYGQPPGGPEHNVLNAQDIYNQMLTYFKTRAFDQLFIVITAPPRHPNNTNFTGGDAARFLNNWLVDNWLQVGNWEGKNVAVFDLFNVLTDSDHHHRVLNNRVQHTYEPRTTSNPEANYSAYSDTGDVVNTNGLQKATEEFMPLLNLYWRRWQATFP